MMSNSA